MKSREEAAKLIHKQMHWEFDKPEAYKDLFWKDHDYPMDQWHYGILELRELLDFIYEDKPKSKEEELSREA